MDDFYQAKITKNRNVIVKNPRDGSDQECWGDYFGKDIYQLPLNYNANYLSERPTD